MNEAYCPHCDARVIVDSPREGRRIRCRACGAELQVVDVDPLDLDFADWRDGRRDEDRDRHGSRSREHFDEAEPTYWYESSPLYQAAYGEGKLNES